MNGNQLITKHSAKFDTVEKSKRPGVLATLRGPVTGWKPNRNGRTYSRDLWVKALNSDYVKEQVALNHFVGEADHPEERLEPVIQNMSHAMRDFEFDDANQEVIATIDILDTPCGNMLKTLYDYSGALSFSTRGSGDVLEDGEVDPETYQLFAIDAVLRPSYATATVRNLLTESESLHKDKDVKKVLESYSSEKELDESVDWDYFNIFHDINDKYLPDSGEGDNMATQTVTAVNKLVYKWYNDGDVYDNSTPSGLEGWANDLSDYANWLAKNIDGCKDILDRIFEIHYGDNGAYEDLLKDLANNCLDENLLSGLATQPKEGSVYECSGDYSFDESRNYDEEYDESENLEDVNTKTDLSKKYIFNDKGVERTVTEVEPLAYRDGYKFREILDNGSVGKVVHTMSKADFDSLKELTEDTDSVVAIPDDVKEAVETEVYNDRNIDVRSSMFKGNDFVVEARNELSEDEFTKIVDRIQYHFNNYGIVYDSIEDDDNNVIAIDCGMSTSAYEVYKANSDDYILNDESFTMYNADTDKTVRVYKDGGKWVDEDGNRYMGYLTKSDVKKYFKGNWVELDESEQLNEYGDTKDYSEDIQKLFKKWFKENADLGIRAWQAMTDSYHLDIETMDKGEGSERRKLYKVVNNSPFVEVEDWADEIGEYIADNLHSLKYIKHTFNDKSFFSDDETAGDITWYFVQQIGMPDFGDNIFDSEKLSEDNEPKTTKEFRIIDTETGKILKVFKDDEESKGYEEMRAMGEELKKAGKEDNLIYKEFRVKNKPERLKEDSTWAEIMIDRALESGVRKTQYQDVDGVKDQYYVVANFQDVGTRADARKYCKAQGWSAVNDSTLDKGVMYRYPLVIYIPADKLPDGVQVINEAGVNLDVSAGVDLPDDAMLSILYNPGDFMTKEEAEAQKKEQSKNDTSSRREIVNVGTDSAGNPVGKSTNTVTYPNREVESVDFLDDYFAYHKGNF